MLEKVLNNILEASYGDRLNIVLIRATLALCSRLKCIVARHRLLGVKNTKVHVTLKYAAVLILGSVMNKAIEKFGYSFPWPCHFSSMVGRKYTKYLTLQYRKMRQLSFKNSWPYEIQFISWVWSQCMICIKGFKAIILLQVWPGIQSTLRSCISCYLWKVCIILAPTVFYVTE